MQGVMASDSLSALPMAAKSLPATSFMSTVALTPGETSSTGSKTGERALKSSWIRRLKPRDEPENAKQNAVNIASESEECCGLCIEKVNAESSSQPVGGHSQERTFTNPQVEKLATKTKALDRDKKALNFRTESSPDTRQKIVNGQKDYGVDRRRNGFGLGKESSKAVPSSIGFGPWINPSAGIRLEGKPQTEPVTVNVNYMHASDTVVASQSCNQAGEGATQKSNNGRTEVEASALASSMGKPPLPRAQSKLGFTPRPVGLQTQGSSLLPAGRAASSPHGKGAAVFKLSFPDAQSMERPLYMPVSAETLSAKKCTVVKPTGIRVGPLLKDAHPSKEGCSDFINTYPKEHMAYTSEKGSHSWAIPAAHGDRLQVPAVEPVTRQLVVSYSDGLSSLLMAKPWGNNKREAFEGTDAIPLEPESSIRSSKDFIRVETPKISHEIGVANLHSGPPSGVSISARSIAAVKQTASKELKGSTLQQSPSEGSCRTARSDRVNGVAEPALSASTTASFPWEMFVEAAGPSKTAREQFVEVYNRARAELKNQRASHAIKRISDKEMENGQGLMSGHGIHNHDIPTDRPERQTSERQQQPLEYSQSLEKLKNINGSLDHKVQSWGVNAKALNAYVSQREQLARKQHAVSFAEGKVQDLLEMEAQAFRTIHGANGGDDAALVSGQHGGSFQDYICPAAASKDCQRALEKSSEGGVHARQSFVRNSALEHHHQVDKEFSQRKGLGIAAGVSNDFNDRQDESPVLLGKRQGGIFDSDVPSALVAGKGPTVHGESFPNRSHVWLQRWHPNIHSIKGVYGHKLLQSGGGRQDSARCSAGGINSPKDGDGRGAFEKATEMKSTFAEKGVFAQRIGTEPESEHLKTCPTKNLPSAAAMAIVGTTARQFCSAQPQWKSSFTFWSGFGMPAPQNPEAFTGKGKRKHSSETDPSMQS